MRATHELCRAPNEQDEAEFTTGSQRPRSNEQQAPRRARCASSSRARARLTRSYEQQERASEAMWTRAKSAERKSRRG